MFIDLRETGREKEREGEGEREKHWERCERETSMGCLLDTPWPGIEPTAFGAQDNTPTNWATQSKQESLSTWSQTFSLLRLPLTCALRLVPCRMSSESLSPAFWLTCRPPFGLSTMPFRGCLEGSCGCWKLLNITNHLSLLLLRPLIELLSVELLLGHHCR